MSQFQELNKYINKIMFKILDNQELCKLLYYNCKNYSEQPKIEDVEELLFNNIFPYNYTPNEEQEIDKAKNYLNIILNNFENGGLCFKKGSITFNILVHKDYWRTNEGLRPYLIMEQLDSMFNLQHNEGKKLNCGMGRRNNFVGGSYSWLNSDYSGYSLTYNYLDLN